MADYLARVEDSGVSLNVAALAGHLGHPRQRHGLRQPAADGDELRGMQRLLDEALERGRDWAVHGA